MSAKEPQIQQAPEMMMQFMLQRMGEMQESFNIAFAKLDVTNKELTETRIAMAKYNVLQEKLHQAIEDSSQAKKKADDCENLVIQCQAAHQGKDEGKKEIRSSFSVNINTLIAIGALIVAILAIVYK